MTNTLRFRLEYFTQPGESISVVGNNDVLGSWDISKGYRLTWKGKGMWEGLVNFKEEGVDLEYKYVLQTPDGSYVWEGGKNKQFSFWGGNEQGVTDLVDYWQSPDMPEVGYLYASLFKVVFSRERDYVQSIADLPDQSVRFRIEATVSLIQDDEVVRVSGSSKSLGNWSIDNSVALSYNGDKFVTEIVVPYSSFPLEFKLLTVSKNDRSVKWELGENRVIDVQKPGSGLLGEPKTVVYSCLYKRSDYSSWRGAGVAIPVFSLRTKNSLGVGEFLDLKSFVDLSAKMGMQIIQILPINDTSNTFTWRDSYPYSGLSVFALHPIYLNIQAITDDEELKEQIQAEADKLNQLPQIDYEAVLHCKLNYIKQIFESTSSDVLSSPQFKDYYAKNSWWLVPYAVYKALSSKYETTNFNNWPKEYRNPEQNDIVEWSSMDTLREECEITYFTQYHLHCQLEQAAQYAALNKLGFKGDLPIGVYRTSVDCWMYPHLFNLSTSTGAPPDQFAEYGQNWGFPTYNWEEMKKDNYSWWKKRLQHMANYFTAFRIDHILGFFRIWEIPADSFSSGLMGHFYPSIPLHRSEFESKGIWDFERLCLPYITDDYLNQSFKNSAQLELIKDRYFQRRHTGLYIFKEPFNTEVKLLSHFKGLEEQLTDQQREDFILVKGVLLDLVKNVVLLKQSDNNNDNFYPRINLHKTSSYQSLDDHSKSVIWNLYENYFYHRQDDMWMKIGQERLPVIKAASDMLVCGEDLGMLPKCIFPVMKDCSILGLRVQRMPPDPTEKFGNPKNYPYMSVCTPGSHDCSTLRGWWEENRQNTEEYYRSILGGWDSAPLHCEPWISKKIIEQHLSSPAMWAIFPLQDFFGMFGDLRVEDPNSEQINEPSNPEHYWRYRMHVSVDDLLDHREFATAIHQMVKQSGRHISITY
eukprot:TRINITY_DN12120_c0_g1_i1.p1 TRINITY_DN12120_c0_g1~~TRINITY_DN12120_c0_g1_i1.p1  ORF type:complete len:935 (+),score=194.70 TRINITY_DN12120_c0_g1_i1:47-2806(+)